MYGEIIVRQMVNKDIEKIRSLALKTPEIQSDNNSSYFEEGELGQIVGDPDYLFYVATFDGKFAGYSLACATGDGCVDLAELVVEQSSREKRIARGLLFITEIEATRRGFSFLQAYVSDDNLVAIKVLERYGFNVGERVFADSPICQAEYPLLSLQGLKSKLFKF